MKIPRFEQDDDFPGKRSIGSRFRKRRMNKAMRKAAKEDPENAPKKKRFNGYVL
jgi:hypothetical protein